MLKINNNNIDLILQVEDYSNIQHIFDSLDLYIDEVLIICPILFFQRFIQANHEELSLTIIEELEKISSLDYINFNMKYHKKDFRFHFIITENIIKTINNPTKGIQSFNVGFKKINIV